MRRFAAEAWRRGGIVVAALCLGPACREIDPRFMAGTSLSASGTGETTGGVADSSSSSLTGGDPSSSGVGSSAGSGGTPVCGNGVVEMGEECDDTNADNTDECVEGCVAATCGDGFVQAGVEECDDTNADNTDECIDTCLAATCGDGFVQAAVEVCDGTDLAGQTCAALGQPGGALACDGACALDTTGCVCGMSQPPIGGMCPAECTGGCMGMTCNIDCAASSACRDAVVACPPDWDCVVTCDGVNACRGATLSCDAHSCQIDCSGTFACRNAVVNCGDGTCALGCADTPSTCRDLALNCGSNDSAATCQAPTNIILTPLGGAVCSCEVVGC